MIVGIGNDIIEIDRIEQAVQNNPRFLGKYFTLKERDCFQNKKNPYESIAGNFAAKEAVSKALGTGFRTFAPSDIEVLRNEKGAPIVFLYNEAQRICHEKKIHHIWITISHCKKYATACAIAESI